ncbi:MAG TPA: zinc-dependent metalloprotease, partial [Longimicrobiaceae bacterium]|nr:zinc-dependent metalloprotease [Longimicrobiaceae bacterium]
TVDGPVASGHFRGQFRPTTVFSIRRSFNKLEFVQHNTGFHFDAGSPLARAANANISPSVMAVQEIVARDAEKGDFLIKADDIFLTEALAQVKPSPFPGPPPPQPQFSLGALSRGKTKYAGLYSYPKNTDVEIDYVYENPAPVAGGDPGVTDARNVTVRVRHSFIEMPENDFRPRFDDPRVGFFTNQVTDLTSTSATPYRDLISRWHLVKKDPGAAVSEPVEPIVFWIENTTPAELRETIRLATLEWNQAFERAGFRNAVEVRVQPDDAEWDAGDIRYNVIRWTSSPAPPFGGYGPRFVNPRTGQVLGADIMLEYVFVTNRLRGDRLFSTAALATEAEGPALADPDACTLGEQMQHATMFGAAALRTAGASEVEVNENLRTALYYLVLHEVGHTLGLTHNMRASQMLSPEQVRDPAAVRAGLYGSVMDYPAVNLRRGGGAAVQMYTTTPGPYDVWAITYGYSPELEDRGRLQAHLARSTEPGHAYGNDADDMRSPGKAVDPRVNIFDLTNDAVGYAIDRFEIVNGVLGGLRQRYATPGQSYHELLAAYFVSTGEYASAAAVVSRYVGGVYVERAYPGQPGAGRPFTPVARADQKRAMAALAKYVFAPDAFAGSADLYAHLQAQRRGFNHFNAPEDPRIHARALNIQGGVLSHLLHPATLGRISDARLYGNEYPLAEVFADLTDAVFAADARGSVNSFRQNLQVEYVTRLTRIVAPAPNQYDYLSRSVALQQLREIRRLLAGKPGGDAATRAHTGHVLLLIDRALETD